MKARRTGRRRGRTITPLKRRTSRKRAETDEEQPSEDNLGRTTVQEESIAPGTTMGGHYRLGRPPEPRVTAPTTKAWRRARRLPLKTLVPATVARAVDGDTVELEEAVDGYDTVRLIGVNTPEMEGGRRQPGAGCGRGVAVHSGFPRGRRGGVGNRPRGRRRLRGVFWPYVWLVPDTGEPELFNRTLIADGHAETLTIEPNDAYAECFEAQAEQAGSGPGVSEDQYQLTGSTGGPGSTGLEETEAVGPSGGETVEEQLVPAPPDDTGETTEGTTGEGADLPIANPEAQDLAAVPPESCPGTNMVLEPFGTNGGAQSEPFEVTGGTFVVRADLKSDNPADARLDVSILDTETQEPVEEFDQRAVGSYDTTISQGPGSYLLSLEPKGRLVRGNRIRLCRPGS